MAIEKISRLQKWLMWADAMWKDEGGLVTREGNLRTSEKNGLTYMTMRDFLSRWQGSLEEYYGEEFEISDGEIITDTDIKK